MSAMEHDLLAAHAGTTSQQARVQQAPPACKACGAAGLSLLAFPDKPPRMQQRIAGVIDLLSEDARKPVTDIAEELDLPLSSAHDCLMLVLSRLEMRTVFTPLPAKIPEPRFRCPQCKSDNTEPDRQHNEATGKTKITGARCRDCGCGIRRGQLSPTLVRRMEG